MVTPTTKAADHDVPISPEEILAQGLVSAEDWATVRATAAQARLCLSHSCIVLLVWPGSGGLGHQDCVIVPRSASLQTAVSTPA